MTNIVCFHAPNEENGYLSNWYLSTFVYQGVAFSSMEQFMMFRKALLFRDTDSANKILSTSDVAKIKSLGRQVSNFNQSIWDNSKMDIVTTGLIAKFSDYQLRRKLLSTGDSILAECAVRDTIWGIGLSMTDSRRLNPLEWRGSNLLGKCLMNVRRYYRLQDF